MTTPTDYMDAHGACPHCGLRPAHMDRHDCHNDLGAIVHRAVERVVIAGKREHIALLRELAAALEDKR